MVHVGWSALSVSLLALYLAFSINQALSNGVEDIDGCESFQPIYGGGLPHHVYQTLKVPGSIYCLRACDDDIRCQSINHVVHGEICELNNRTKEARPEAFTTDDTKVYMKKFRKRSRWRRFAKSLVFLFSRIRPGFQVGYPMEVLVMVMFRFRLLGWKKLSLWKIIAQNLLSFQRVQDIIDLSNFNFKASKLIVNHRKKCNFTTLFSGLFQNTCPRAMQLISFSLLHCIAITSLAQWGKGVPWRTCWTK